MRVLNIINKVGFDYTATILYLYFDCEEVLWTAGQVKLLQDFLYCHNTAILLRAEIPVTSRILYGYLRG